MKNIIIAIILVCIPLGFYIGPWLYFADSKESFSEIANQGDGMDTFPEIHRHADWGPAPTLVGVSWMGRAGITFTSPRDGCIKIEDNARTSSTVVCVDGYDRITCWNGEEMHHTQQCPPMGNYHSQRSPPNTP